MTCASHVQGHVFDPCSLTNRLKQICVQIKKDLLFSFLLIYAVMENGNSLRECLHSSLNHFHCFGHGMWYCYRFLTLPLYMHALCPVTVCQVTENEIIALL